LNSALAKLNASLSQTLFVRQRRGRIVLQEAPVKTSKLLVALFLTSTIPLGAQTFEHRVLATNRTSTMEKELNDSAKAGFRLQSAMGGQRLLAGDEVAVVMSRPAGETTERYRYRVLAANKTSTMQRELQAAADDGYEYRTQTVFNTAYGGKEVVVILERELGSVEPRSEYLLLATNRTSTMDKELSESGSRGFEVLGLTVGQTAFGGNELIVILRRPRGTK
jgi:hypothetical protein